MKLAITGWHCLEKNLSGTPPGFTLGTLRYSTSGNLVTIGYFIGANCPAFGRTVLLSGTMSRSPSCFFEVLVGRAGAY